MKNRSVSFPDEINDILNQEAERQGISFNKVVVNAVTDKYSPDSYDKDIANRSDGGIREVDCEDTFYKNMKLHLAAEDIARLRQFADEANLSVTELIRRYARFGKVEKTEIKISGMDKLCDDIIPLIEDLSFFIRRYEDNEDNQTISDMREIAIQLLSEIINIKKDLFNLKRRINRRLEKEGR